MNIDNSLTGKARFWFCALLCALLCWVSVAGNGWAAGAKEEAVSAHHPLQDIYSQVQTFLQQDQGGEGVSIEVKPLDSRLRLKYCEAPLSINYQRNRGRSGRLVVEVRCVGSTPWRIYVTARVNKKQHVVTTIAPVLKGERIKLSNLVVEERDLSKLRRGYFESKQQLEGKFAKRAIQGGVVLTPRLLFVPNAIDKGDQVSILIQRGELRVQMEGVAIEDGRLDGKIRVKNRSSGKVVEGVVVAPGRVMVTR